MFALKVSIDLDKIKISVCVTYCAILLRNLVDAIN